MRHFCGDSCPLEKEKGMSFPKELTALVAGQLRGIREGEGLEEARCAVEGALRAEADRQSWLQRVEQLKAEGFGFLQLTSDVLNPKPDGRKAQAFRKQQFWSQGSVFVARDEEIGQLSPSHYDSEAYVSTGRVPANIADAIYQNSRKLTMAEAIKQHDRQKAVLQAEHKMRCREMEEGEEE
jgi:hypothetical protein